MAKKISVSTQTILAALLLMPVAASAAEAAGESGGFINAIAEFFDAGGPFIYVNCITLCWGIAIIIERIIFIFFKYNVNAEAFMAQVQKLVMANDIERAIKLCNAAPAAALPKVVRAGLTRANRGELEIRNSIEEATLAIVPVLQKRTPNLASIANLATLLGLLGTITGLITAVALVRPSRSLHDLKPSSVRKKWKDRAFAAGANREEIARATEEFGIELWEHTGNIIQAMRGIAPQLGFDGN